MSLSIVMLCNTLMQELCAGNHGKWPIIGVLSKIRLIREENDEGEMVVVDTAIVFERVCSTAMVWLRSSRKQGFVRYNLDQCKSLVYF